MKHRPALALLFVIGCATGGVAAQLVVPPVRAGTSPTRWEYQCLRVRSGEVTATTNQLGAQGWELASVAPAHQTHDWPSSDLETDAYLLCAKRALP